VKFDWHIDELYALESHMATSLQHLATPQSIYLTRCVTNPPFTEVILVIDDWWSKSV